MGVRLTRYLVALLCVLIGGYLAILPFTAHHPAAHSIAKEGGSRIRLTAVTPDGSAPNHDTLSAAQQIIAARVSGLKISGSQVVVEGNSVVVTVPGNNTDEFARHRFHRATFPAPGAALDTRAAVIRAAAVRPAQRSHRPHRAREAASSKHQRGRSTPCLAIPGQQVRQ